MKKSLCFIAITSAITLLTCSSAAEAKALSTPEPSLVNANDTFTFDYAGFNTASGAGYILGGGTATFGTPLTLATGGVNGQSITLTSTEAVNGTTTTDTFMLTTPTNFITTTTVNGTKITALQFDIGDANSGVIPGAPDTVDYTLPVTGKHPDGRHHLRHDLTFCVESDHDVDQWRHVPGSGGRRERRHDGDLHPGGA